MQCQQCKQQTATIHLTEINNGVRVETHLCEFCAEQEGIAIKSQIPLNELLSSLLASQDSAKAQPAAEKEEIADATECPSCGMTVQAFRKGGLLGCPNDYDAFEDVLAPVIQKSQGGNTEHIGKSPSKAPEDNKKQIEKINLRKELEEAVRDEDYERAAQLRDQIESLQ